jgi:UDP:flavonoid glycosyltransferase YjiC (YdhE family)
MTRFLLQAHAPTTGLAHVGTAIAIGTELQRRGHEVGIAYGGSQPELIEAAGLRRHPVAEVEPAREWSHGQWFRSVEELSPVVDSHVDAIESAGAEVVVACHGVAGRLAAEIAGRPSLHVFHYLQTTSYARSVSVNGDRLRDLRHPRRVSRVGRARIRRLRSGGTTPMRSAIAELRRERGLPEAGSGAIAGCPDSLVAISTAPFLLPARGLPETWHYVGPISWSPPAPAPAVPKGEGPLAYVTQGSTGEAALLERATTELAAAGFQVIVTTARLLDPDRLRTADGRVHAARLLDGVACMRQADVAVIHAGHQTLVEAIRSATPVVAIPTRADQIGHLHRVEGLRIGFGLYPPPRRRGAIARAARRALAPRIRRRCRELADRLDQGWDGVRNSADLAESLAAGGASGSLDPGRSR